MAAQLLVLGLAACLARAPRLGRPRPEPPSGEDRPVAHPEALGALLARTGAGRDARPLDAYRRWRQPVDWRRPARADRVRGRPVTAPGARVRIDDRPDRLRRSEPLERRMNDSDPDPSPPEIDFARRPAEPPRPRRPPGRGRVAAGAGPVAAWAGRVLAEINKVFIGQDALVRGRARRRSWPTGTS